MSPGFATLDAAAEAAILAGRRGGAAARAAAFEAAFRGLREPVLALALHLTGRRADAEDVVQETFLAVHGALPGFRGECRLSTWIYRIALRAALRIRSRRREGEPLDLETPAPGGGEAALAAREASARLASALASLSAEHRAVLSLFAVEGLSHREIGDVLGVPEGTVWSRLHVARRRLAEALRDPGPRGRRP